MNFFEHQAQARRRTSWLFALFSIVVVLLVWTVYSAITLGLFAAEFFLTQEGWRDGWIIASFWQYDRFVWVALLTTLILVIGAAYKIHQLKQGGGAMVAEQLGGKRLPPHAQDMLHRRVLNVVEEMAIASGLPVPPVYILQESGINAFAAGFTSSDTVIGVTQGAIEMLNRDELQAVMGHEFSHILHGDSRINMRMVGLLHGMTLISYLGSSLLTGHASSHLHRKKNGSHPALWILGMLLFLAGLLGMIAADLIKLAISRQREFLADASAVQFTRNPEAMAHALMTIGGYQQGSHLSHQDAANLGYFFFSHTELKALQRPPKYKNWWASHPPLQQRIQRILPSFRGHIPDVDMTQKQQRVRAEASVGVHYAMPAHARVLMDKKTVLTAVGEMAALSLQDVQQQLHAIPKALRDFAHDPYSARAMAYAMLLSDDKSIRKQQWACLEKKADPNVMRDMLDMNHLMDELPSHLRLPLLDMLMPALKSLSQAQYQQLIANIRLLIQADHHVSMFEYALHRMLLRHLKPTFEGVHDIQVRYQHIKQVAGSCACVLSMLIQYGQHEHPKQLLARVSLDLLGESMPWPPARLLQMKYLDQSISQLEQASPEVKRSLLTACVDVIFADGICNEHEMEALRAIADGMDCPIAMVSM